MKVVQLTRRKSEGSRSACTWNDHLTGVGVRVCVHAALQKNFAHTEELFKVAATIVTEEKPGQISIPSVIFV